MTKNEFYDFIIQNYGESELSSILVANHECNFYEVCQGFLNIALNAQIIKEKSGEKKRLFRHIEIIPAEELAASFCREYNITNLDEFFSIIEHEFHESQEESDNRKKACLIREDDLKENCFGYFGTMYVLNEISEEVFVTIVNEIKEKLV